MLNWQTVFWIITLVISIRVKSSKSIVVWDSFLFHSAAANWFDSLLGLGSFFEVFAKVPTKSEFLSFLHNIPVETDVLISPSRSGVDKSLQKSLLLSKLNILLVAAFCLLLLLICWILLVMSVRLIVLECTFKIGNW